jgi:hypothetical protein
VRAIARGDQDAPAKSDFLSAIGQHAEGLGGGVSGGLESLLGAVGLTGLQKRLAGWSEDPANKKLLGGTTAIAGTLLTAMLARKLLGGRSQRQEPNYGPMTREASLSPASIFAAGMVKRGYPQTMGTPIKPLKGQKSKTATPRRLGIHGSHRQRTHDKLKQQRVASASPLGR